jgi:tetratricopeptide (TPR) repeat protein
MLDYIKKMVGLPTKSNELTYWGISDFKKGKYKSALKYFKEALELNPDNEYIQTEINKTRGKIQTMRMNLVHDMVNITGDTIDLVGISISEDFTKSHNLSFNYNNNYESKSDLPDFSKVDNLELQKVANYNYMSYPNLDNGDYIKPRIYSYIDSQTIQIE